MNPTIYKMMMSSTYFKSKVQNDMARTLPRVLVDQKSALYYSPNPEAVEFESFVGSWVELVAES